MSQIIPLFLAEDEENTSSMACQRVFRDLNDPINPDKVCSIIVSCAVLYNIAIQWK